MKIKVNPLEYQSDLLELFKLGYLLGYCEASGEKLNKETWDKIKDNVRKDFEKEVINKNGHKRSNRGKQRKGSRK